MFSYDCTSSAYQLGDDASLRQGVFEAPIVGLLFWAFSLGPPLAKSQKMVDLGVLYGHFWSRGLQFSYDCTSSAYQLRDDVRQGVYEAPIVAYFFENFPLVPPWQNLRKWPI